MSTLVAELYSLYTLLRKNTAFCAVMRARYVSLDAAVKAIRLY